MDRPLRLLAMAIAVVALTSCSSSQDDDVSSAARAFYAAVDGGDGASACDYLMPAVREELEKSSGKPCATELLAELPRGGGDLRVSAYGTMAQVRTSADTAFLHRFHGSWRVLAAGCRATPTGTYDCTVRGS